ncbi:hypothetical protein C5167_041766 [Papaver somniferum]|nr:hypothetical protein C5167_041766 [Papaver somniferum]
MEVLNGASKEVFCKKSADEERLYLIILGLRENYEHPRIRTFIGREKLKPITSSPSYSLTGGSSSNMKKRPWKYKENG